MPKILKITPLKDGLEEARGAQLWDKVEKFAQYSFNKSHSVEYSLISYQCMWLKCFYPVEFYAAAFTILGDEKMATLLVDARERGISVVPPDINNSTGRFEILTDSKLAAPLNVVVGLSAKGTDAILTARAAGRFESKEDFLKRTPRRSCNATIVQHLDDIGAFARIEPESLPSDHPERRSALLEWCPTIVSGGALVTREIPRDRATVDKLKDIFNDLRASDSPCIEGALMATPKFGKRAKFMVITDGPTWTEERESQFTKGSTFLYCAEALAALDLDVEDAYWTGLCKIPKSKGAKFYSAEQVAAFAPTLRAEIDLLNPQVLLLLGSTTVRTVATSLKGSPTDHAGKVVYDKGTEGKDDDRNIVIGISPGMVSFDSAKQETLEDAFRIVKEMIT